MFKGSLPAMVTPFNNGEVDVKALRNLVNWHIEQGSHGLVPVGTTGESPTLTHTEHEQVVSEVINAAAGIAKRAVGRIVSDIPKDCKAQVHNIVHIAPNDISSPWAKLENLSTA